MEKLFTKHKLFSSSFRCYSCFKQNNFYSNQKYNLSFNNRNNNNNILLNNNYKKNKNYNKYSYTFGILSASLSSAFIFYANDNNNNNNNNDNDNIKAGERIENLPEYSRDEISKHKTIKDRIWVYYKHGVYDITEFIESHPGGTQKIMLAAGGSIEPYWKLFAQHHSNLVYEILESWRIGNLSDYEESNKSLNNNSNDPYANEPERSPILIVNAQKPFNAETPLELLAENIITPTELFYVRNHLPVPIIDPDTYKLDIDIIKTNNDNKSLKLSYSLDELKHKFKEHTITATIQCAGNRRDELSDYNTVKGLSWRGGAIGNATWTGIKLRDVLLDAGYEINDNTLNQHCIFNGLDGDGMGTFYSASVPMKKVMDEFGDVLLAFKMNGEELNGDHGYPVRVIIPGHVGARNVKWLSQVIISNEESSSHWQRKDYKSFSPATDWNNLDWTSAPSIQELPVQSLICTPSNGTIIQDYEDEIELKGYAWSGGGRDIARVDICINNEKWYQANLEKSQNNPYSNWGWCLWKVKIPIPETMKGKISISCRAVDDSYNSQPEYISTIWNARGVNNNTCHNIIIEKE